VLGRADGFVVEVGPHPVYGTLATIAVTGADDQVIAKLRAAVTTFQFRCEVVGAGVEAH
jgi:hypothetical protein